MNENIVRDEMHELINLTAKYSRGQLAMMLTQLDIDVLHENMIKNGATRDDLQAVSELHHDVTTVYGYI